MSDRLVHNSRIDKDDVDPDSIALAIDGAIEAIEREAERRTADPTYPGIIALDWNTVQVLAKGVESGHVEVITSVAILS